MTLGAAVPPTVERYWSVRLFSADAMRKSLRSNPTTQTSLAETQRSPKHPLSMLRKARRVISACRCICWEQLMPVAGHRTLGGQCFCSAVHYAVADEFLYAANCHCSNCRRTTGSAFKPFAGIEREKFAVTKGGDKLMIYGDDIGHD